jgi:hypothetical protein
VQVAIGRYSINGFPALASTTMLQVRENGAMFTSDIIYTDAETASQAAGRQRAMTGIEIQQNGNRVIYRRAGAAAATGIGGGNVNWRW